MAVGGVVIPEVGGFEIAMSAYCGAGELLAADLGMVELALAEPLTVFDPLATLPLLVSIASCPFPLVSSSGLSPSPRSTGCKTCLLSVGSVGGAGLGGVGAPARARSSFSCLSLSS